MRNQQVGSEIPFIDPTRLITGVALQQLFVTQGREDEKQEAPAEIPTNAEYLNRPLTTAELAPIAAIISRSDRKSHKSKTLRRLLGLDVEKVTLRPAFLQISEEVEEGDYNALAPLGRDPRLIAAVKAFSGRRYQGRTSRERFNMVYEDVHERAAAESIQVNEMGTVYFWRAQDVVTSYVREDGSEVRLLKPKTTDKQEIMRQIGELFDVHNTSASEYVRFDLKGADAIYEAVYDVGVVCQDTAHLKMKRPTPEFLECYYMGTAHILDNSPEPLRQMAQEFQKIFDQESHQPSGRGSLRGWTPQSGAKNAHTVNGGFMSDSSFVQQLLVEEISFDGDKTVFTKGGVGFEEARQKALAIVLGEPVSFNRMTRVMMDILKRKIDGAEISAAHKDASFITVSQALNALPPLLKGLQGSEVFGGRWYDASPKKGEYKIDEDDLRNFIVAMLAQPGMLQ